MAVSAEREWLELVADLLASPLEELPAERIALQLLSTFQGTACSWTAARPDGTWFGGIYPLDDQLGGRRAFVEEWGPVNTPLLHPVVLQARATGRAEVQQVADVPDRFVPPGLRGAWQGIARSWGGADQVLLPMGGTSSLVVGATTPFSPAAMDLARLVHRLLLGLDRQCRALAGRGADPATARDLRLTPRQLAVLGLLVEGLTAAAIGHRLGISERTVHKHLEHLYARLGAHDRLTAVLRARDEGLLPPAGRGARG